jgi:hypothetical protein
MYHSRYHPETSIQTRGIGLYGDELVIPNHTLGPDRWLDSPTHTYLQQGLDLETRLNLPTDTDNFDHEAVSALLSAFHDLAQQERVLPIIAWFYAAPLRPYVDTFQKDMAFHHLNVLSEKEYPTKSLLATLWGSFGMTGEPYPVNSRKTLIEIISATNGIPVWLHGYDPQELTDEQLLTFHGSLWEASVAGFAGEEDVNNRSDTQWLRAPCVISDSEPIPDQTVRDLVIETRLKTETTEIKKTIDSLFGDVRLDTGSELPQTVPKLNHHALAYYQYVTSVDTEIICSAWQWARRHTDQNLSPDTAVNPAMVTSINKRGLNGIQTVAFGIEMYNRFVEWLDAPLDPIVKETTDETLKHVIDMKSRAPPEVDVPPIFDPSAGLTNDSS